MLTDEELKQGYREGIVYMYVCLCNLKVYVGQTINEPVRKRAHSRGSTEDSELFHRAIRKYGIERFSYKVLYSEKVNYTVESEAENLHNKLDELEIYYIKKFNSTNKSLGYNITEGGKGTRGALKNPESLEKYRTTRKNKKKEDPTYCIPRAHAVLLFDLVGNLLNRFNTVTEASIVTGVSIQLIINRCKISDKISRKSHVDKFGNVWIYEDEYEKYKDIFPLENPHKNLEQSNGSVIKFTLEGNKLKEYETTVAAVLDLFPEYKGNRSKIATATSNISYAATGRLRDGKRLIQQAYGFRWKMKSDYIEGEKLPPMTEIPKTIPSCYKAVIKMDLKDNVLEEYQSTRSAAEALNLFGNINNISHNISLACSGKPDKYGKIRSNIAYGFKWKLK